MLKGFDPTAAATAFLITAVLLWLLQPVASRFGLLDRPSGRKDHAVPTPVIGGLGILIGCLTAFFVVQADGPGMLAFCTASVMLVAVGLYDDLYDLRWYWRIFVQAAAAVDDLPPALGLHARAEAELPALLRRIADVQPHEQFSRKRTGARRWWANPGPPSRMCAG